MGILEAIILGIIEGFTEFLPISSTAHLTIAEKVMGFYIKDPGYVAFTAIIQTGAVIATIIYFRKDVARLVSAWFEGIFSASKRGRDYKFGWAVIIGSIPIAIIGLAFKDQIETGVRSLWLIAAALIIWSGVMWLADRTAKLNRHEKDADWKDTLFIGVMQVLALIPGVSRSGATISGGLFRGLDRVTATRLSFFLAIPALLAAGLLEAVTKADNISSSIGWIPTIVATVVTFLTAYMTVAWLLRYISKHGFGVFIIYRIALGILLIVLLSTGAIAAA